MKTFFSSLCVLTLAAVVLAQPHEHGHDHGAGTKVSRPRVFLDKSPRIVWYQLDRLSNERLLLVERATDDPKYKPVYTAILTRAGMSRSHREDALAGLVELEESDPVTELLAALGTLDSDQRRVGRQLAGMLLGQSQAELLKKSDALRELTKSDNASLRAIGHAGLTAAGQSAQALAIAKRNTAAMLDFLAAVSLVPRPKDRASLRGPVVAALDESNPPPVRRSAISALAEIPSQPKETFRLVAPFVSDETYRDAAVRTLLAIPKQHRDADASAELVETLVAHAEKTPAEQRTTDDFLDAMQLVDQLLALVPADQARADRDRLRAVTVRVVRIRTVEEEMRYDTEYFAVEAGRPVQVVLENEDLMPHNFVITVPGALREVAQLGSKVPQGEGPEPKQFVPKSPKVLWATDLVQAGRQARLTFTAPAEPGEYPYVCTFPRHWMRMYGVMVVVEDLTEWQKNPQKPTDPVGNTRSFVKSWTVDDFKGGLETGLRGRSLAIGAQIFKDATCAQCHKVQGRGGAVGPELTDVFKRWKGNRLGILQEVLDPSHKVDPKYAVQLVATLDGKVVTGIVKAEDKDTISVLVNPEAPEPTVIPRDNIDEIVKSTKSMMPKALLDRFTKDEIFELLNYLENAETAPPPVK